MSKTGVVATGRGNWKQGPFDIQVELEDKVKSLERQLVIARKFIRGVGCEHWYQEAKRCVVEMEKAK